MVSKQKWMSRVPNLEPIRKRFETIFSIEIRSVQDIKRLGIFKLVNEYRIQKRWIHPCYSSCSFYSFTSHSSNKEFIQSNHKPYLQVKVWPSNHFNIFQGEGVGVHHGPSIGVLTILGFLYQFNVVESSINLLLINLIKSIPNNLLATSLQADAGVNFYRRWNSYMKLTNCQ